MKINVPFVDIQRYYNGAAFNVIPTAVYHLQILKILLLIAFAW